MKQKLLIAYAVIFILVTLFYSVAFSQRPKENSNEVLSETSFTK